VLRDASLASVTATPVLVPPSPTVPSACPPPLKAVLGALQRDPRAQPWPPPQARSPGSSYGRKGSTHFPVPTLCPYTAAQGPRASRSIHRGDERSGRSGSELTSKSGLADPGREPGFRPARWAFASGTGSPAPARPGRASSYPAPLRLRPREVWSSGQKWGAGFRQPGAGSQARPEGTREAPNASSLSRPALSSASVIHTANAGRSVRPAQAL
jgi:hypothetical protein